MAAAAWRVEVALAKAVAPRPAAQAPKVPAVPKVAAAAWIVEAVLAKAAAPKPAAQVPKVLVVPRVVRHMAAQAAEVLVTAAA